MKMSQHCKQNRRALWIIALITGAVTVLGGCGSPQRIPDFHAIYDTSAQQMGDDRTPVIVLPGVLGSKIVNAKTKMKIWGAFTFGAADADKPDGAREIASPMKIGIPLSELRDDGLATDVLDYVEADIGIFRGLKLGAYVDIMRTLAVGKYRDKTLGEKGVVDYGNNHFTMFDIQTWKKYGWGLASKDEDKVLSWLLPEAESAADRHLIALDHREKCLNRADQIYRALDIPASPSSGTKFYIFAGDGIETISTVVVTSKGDVKVSKMMPGDGTVTRGSALMDERVGDQWNPRLRSPVHWSRVQFVNADHLGLCKAPAFVDNLLYLMLESPKPVSGDPNHDTDQSGEPSS